MSPDSLFPRLAAILADVTGAAVESLRPDSTPDNTPGWDSVANLNFVADVEEAFAVALPTAEIIEARSLGQMARLLCGKGVSG